MQELIYLTQRIPFPPTKGEKIRQFQVLCYLRQRYVVHLGCLIDDPSDWQHTGVLRELCGETLIAALALLGLPEDARGVAVAVDGEVVPRAAWPTFKLPADARVEVLAAMQGG